MDTTAAAAKWAEEVIRQAAGGATSFESLQPDVYEKLRTLFIQNDFRVGGFLESVNVKELLPLLLAENKEALGAVLLRLFEEYLQEKINEALWLSAMPAAYSSTSVLQLVKKLNDSGDV